MISNDLCIPGILGSVVRIGNAHELRVVPVYPALALVLNDRGDHDRFPCRINVLVGVDRGNG